MISKPQRVLFLHLYITVWLRPKNPVLLGTSRKLLRVNLFFQLYRYLFQTRHPAKSNMLHNKNCLNDYETLLGLTTSTTSDCEYHPLVRPIISRQEFANHCRVKSCGHPPVYYGNCWRFCSQHYEFKSWEDVLILVVESKGLLLYRN